MIILLLFCLFWFNRGYSVNNRLDFVLIVIKQDYNAYNRLKFIYHLLGKKTAKTIGRSSLKKEEKKPKSNSFIKM